MSRAGISLNHGLSILLADTKSPALHALLRDIGSQLEEGKSLSEAVAGHPGVFSDLYVHTVLAGEKSGRLPDILFQLVAYMEQAEALRNKVKAALYYPMFILMVATVMSLLLFVFGVREFEEIYQGMNVDLPLFATMVIGVGHFLGRFWWLLLALALAAAWLAARALGTPRGQAWRDELLLRVPGLGELGRQLAMARFARTLSSLVASGVPVLDSLDVVSGSLGNRVVEGALRQAAQQVRAGEALSRPLRESDVFTRLAVSMIAVGEESGTLDKMLEAVAVYYEQQVDHALKAAVSLIEPLVILGVGAVVGSLIIALGLPMLTLVQHL